MKIFGIIDTETNTFRDFNGNVCWKSKGGAQLSYRAYQTDWYGQREGLKPWKEQTRFKIVELTEYYFMYKDLCA